MSDGDVDLANNNDKNLSLKEFDENLLKGLGAFTFKNIVGRYYKIEEEQVENRIILEKDEMPIGFRKPDYSLDDEDNLVKVNFHFTYEHDGKVVERKSRVISIIGDKGSGKSWLAGTIIDYVVEQWGMKVFIIDPSGEYFAHKFKWNPHNKDIEEKADELLAKIGRARRGRKITIIAPKFLGEQDNVDIYYSLSFKEIKSMMKSNPKTINYIAELIGIQGDIPNINVLSNIFTPEKLENMFTWSDFERVLNMEKRHTDVRKIFSSYQYRKNIGVFNDDEKTHIDIIDLLVNNEIVIFQGILRTEEDDDFQTILYNTHIKILIDEILYELNKIKRNKPDARIKNRNGIFLVADEADSLIPATGNSTLRNRMVTLATKHRKDMINQIIITQSAAKIDNTLFQQTDYIFTAKIDDINASVFRKKQINQNVIDDLFRLNTEQTTSIGTVVNQFAFLYRMNGQWVHEKFYTNVPISDCLRVV